MKAFRKLTLFLKSIRFCQVCGKKLVRCYVKDESCWRQVCSSCGVITYFNPKVVAGLIPVLPDGRVVIGKRSIEPALGKWSFPAGYQEMGESVEEAAVRETWEEVKVRVKIGPLIGIYSYPDAGVVTIVYQGRVLKGEKPAAGSEVLEVRCCKISQIKNKDLAFRSTIHAFRDFRTKARKK